MNEPMHHGEKRNKYLLQAHKIIKTGLKKMMHKVKWGMEVKEVGLKN